MIVNKIANKITGISNNSETVTNEHDKEVLKERYISPEESQKVIDEVKLM